MKVLKKADLLPEVAKELGIDPKIVELIVNAYWKEVITAVRELRHLNIFIAEIGDLRIARTKLDGVESRMEEYLKKHPPESPQHQTVAKKLEGIRRLKLIRQTEYDKREDVREKRKEYEKTSKNMGEEVEDPGRGLV